MLTQQDLLDRLNQLTLRYNLTWQEVKYDADKAIARINNYLGTIFPKLSAVYLSPESTYSFNSEGVQYAYFDEEYFHSVIIPFIAMEVLARDEEFTTIYNKYAAEVENGLFDMFQKEFNVIPFAFRQNPDKGVFFASPNALAATQAQETSSTLDPLNQGVVFVTNEDGSTVQRNDLSDLPVFKFRVYYDLNNDEIDLNGIPFVEDTRAYLYNDTATIKGWNLEMLSYDGVYAYQFVGWSRGPEGVQDSTYDTGNLVTIMSDIKLYAVWEKVSTLTNTVAGVVSIKDAYKFSLHTLIIPNIVNNNMVREIPTDFLLHPTDPTKHAVNLMTIDLPDYLWTIKSGAFNGFEGSSIILPETERDDITYPGIEIEGNAFIATPNLQDIVIPANVHTIGLNAFPIVNDKTLNIYCRILEQNKPDTWNAQWYADSDVVSNYVVNIMWGHNG